MTLHIDKGRLNAKDLLEADAALPRDFKLPKLNLGMDSASSTGRALPKQEFILTSTALKPTAVEIDYQDGLTADKLKSDYGLKLQQKDNQFVLSDKKSGESHTFDQDVHTIRLFKCGDSVAVYAESGSPQKDGSSTATRVLLNQDPQSRELLFAEVRLNCPVVAENGKNPQKLLNELQARNFEFAADRASFQDGTILVDATSDKLVLSKEGNKIAIGFIGKEQANGAHTEIEARVAPDGTFKFGKMILKNLPKEEFHKSTPDDIASRYKEDPQFRAALEQLPVGEPWRDKSHPDHRVFVRGRDSKLYYTEGEALGQRYWVRADQPQDVKNAKFYVRDGDYDFTRGSPSER